MFPIMLQNLFERVGFGWGTRISGLICGVLCGIAVLTVTSARPKDMPAAQLIGLKCLRDSKYMLLAAGGSLVALGMCFLLYIQVSQPA